MKDRYIQLELAEKIRKFSTFYMHRRLKGFKRAAFWDQHCNRDL